MVKMKSHIAIIGMPWSGKTTTANALAEKLKMNLIDLDKEAEKIEGKDLITIMNEKGAPYFREIGYGLLLKLVMPTVISPAGSVIYHEPSIDWIRENSKVFFLNTPLETIKLRMKGNPKAVSDLKDNGIEGLFEKRFPVYKINADYIIDTQSKDVLEIVNEIISLL